MNLAELSDIQSESGVIGTLIFHPEYILHTDYLLPNYFSGVENGCIYWSIQELYKEGINTIDAYNISNKIQSHKGVAKTIKFKAHDENNDAHIGDTVQIMQTRPLSKDKCWRVIEIIERAK